MENRYLLTLLKIRAGKCKYFLPLYHRSTGNDKNFLINSQVPAIHQAFQKLFHFSHHKINQQLSLSPTWWEWSASAALNLTSWSMASLPTSASPTKSTRSGAFTEMSFVRARISGSLSCNKGTKLIRIHNTWSICNRILNNILRIFCTESGTYLVNKAVFRIRTRIHQS